MKTKHIVAVAGLASCVGMSGAYASATPTVLQASEMDQITAGSGSSYEREHSRRHGGDQKQESRQENKQFGVNANVAALNNIALINGGDQHFHQGNEQKQTNVSVQYQR